MIVIVQVADFLRDVVTLRPFLSAFVLLDV